MSEFSNSEPTLARSLSRASSFTLHSEDLTLKDHADILFSQGSYEAAEDIYRTLHDSCAVLFDAQEVHAVEAAEDLAVVYSRRGKFEAAEELFTRVLSSYKATFGDNDFRVARAYYNLANCYCDQNEHDKAETLYVQALRIFESCPTTGSLLDVWIRIDRSMIMIKQNKAREALETLLEVKSAYAERHSVDQPSYDHCLQGLAIAYTELGDLSTAESYFRETLSRRVARHGGTHLDVYETAYNLGVCLLAQGKDHFEEAESYLVQAMGVETVEGAKHPLARKSRTALESFYYEQGRLEDLSGLEQIK